MTTKTGITRIEYGRNVMGFDQIVMEISGRSVALPIVGNQHWERDSQLIAAINSIINEVDNDD